MDAIATLATSEINVVFLFAHPNVATMVYALRLKPAVVLEAKWEPIVRSIVVAQDMESVLRMEHVYVILVSFSMRHPKSVSLNVWVKQVPTAMLPISSNVVVVTRALAIMEHAHVGPVIVALIVQLKFQYPISIVI